MFGISFFITNLRFRVQYCRRSNGLSYCGIIQASRQDGMVENSYGPKGGIWGRYFFSTGITLASNSKIFCWPLCSDVIVHFFCTSFFYPWNVGKSFFNWIVETNGLGWLGRCTARRIGFGFPFEFGVLFVCLFVCLFLISLEKGVVRW